MKEAKPFVIDSKKSVKKLHEKMKEWKLHSHLDWKLQQVGI